MRTTGDPSPSSRKRSRAPSASRYWSSLRMARDLEESVPAPEPVRGDPCTLAQRLQLQIRDVGIHRAEAGERAEAAVGAGNHALAADDIRETAQPLGDEQRMLDVIGGRAQHARYQDLVIGQLLLTEHHPLVRVARIRT